MLFLNEASFIQSLLFASDHGTVSRSATAETAEILQEGMPLRFHFLLTTIPPHQHQQSTPASPINIRTSSTYNTMSLISAELILVVFAILASLTVASPLDLNQKVTDGYFTMCMRPDFSTWYQGPDWKCEHRVSWISGQCSKPQDHSCSPQTQLTYPRKTDQTPKSLNGYVMSARPEEDYGATCHMYRYQNLFASVFGNRIVTDLPLKQWRLLRQSDAGYQRRWPQRLWCPGIPRRHLKLEMRLRRGLRRRGCDCHCFV